MVWEHRMMTEKIKIEMKDESKIKKELEDEPEIKEEVEDELVIKKEEVEDESEINLRQRVRLFDINEDGGTWRERGIGEISVYYVESYKVTYLLVHAESDGSLLLESEILQDTAYRKQQGRFIIWTEDGQVLGLSFQEYAGCSDVWEIICKVQGKNPYLEIGEDIVIKEENIKKEGVDVTEDIAQEIKTEQPDEVTREMWFEEMLDLEHKELSGYDRDVLEQLIGLVNRLVSPAHEDQIPSPAVSPLPEDFHLNVDVEETERLRQLHRTTLYLLSLRDRH